MSALIIIHSVYCQPRSNMSACLASKYTVSSINSVWSLDYKREILCNLHITHLSDECLVLFAANKIQTWTDTGWHIRHIRQLHYTHHKTINRPGFIIATCFSPPAAAINRTKKKIVLVLIARKDVLSSAIHCPFGNKEIINNFDLNDFLTKIWITNNGMNYKERHICTDRNEY